MPRLFTVHLTSLAAGIVLAGMCFLSMSQATVSTPLRVEYMAHPRDMVQISGLTPYTVPVGKALVITACGSFALSGNGVSMLVNGQLQYSVLPDGVNDRRSVQPVPQGFTVPAGSVVTIQAGSPPDNGRAWGYLVNQ